MTKREPNAKIAPVYITERNRLVAKFSISALALRRYIFAFHRKIEFRIGFHKHYPVGSSRPGFIIENISFWSLIQLSDDQKITEGFENE